MSEQEFLHVQAVEIERLLSKSAGDPVLELQLRDRLSEVERKLQALRRQPESLLPREVPNLPRAAIFLRGGGVQNSDGIRPSLAGEVLIQYEKMFVEQAVHDERMAAQMAGRCRRPRGSRPPELLFVGTPRGSFGLEFVPQFHDDPDLVAIHVRSLENVASALTRIAGSDAASLERVVSEIPPRLLQPLKQFVKTLAQYGAELRLAFQNQASRSLTMSELQIAAELLDRDVQQESIRVTGIFRGLTWDSGVFDLRLADGDTITGYLNDQLTEEDLERIDELTNKPCVADLQKTVVRKVGGTETPTYVLIAAWTPTSGS
jgi:hypothetical protein